MIWYLNGTFPTKQPRGLLIQGWHYLVFWHEPHDRVIIELQLAMGGSLLGIAGNIRDWDRWPVVENSRVNKLELFVLFVSAPWNVNFLMKLPYNLLEYFHQGLQSIARPARSRLRFRNIGVWNFRLPPGQCIRGQMKCQQCGVYPMVNLPFGSIEGCFFEPPIYRHSRDG